MFDAIEAINDIIDDINEDAAEYAESCYEEIYDELCYRVECGDLTLEEAEMVNQVAYEKYFGESGEDDEAEFIEAAKNASSQSLESMTVRELELLKQEIEQRIAAGSPDSAALKNTIKRINRTLKAKAPETKQRDKKLAKLC